MKQLLKKFISFTLAFACVITMLPTSAYAEFNTDSSVASGSGKQYNTLTNIVNVGYRISLYYIIIELVKPIFYLTFLIVTVIFKKVNE